MAKVINHNRAKIYMTDAGTYQAVLCRRGVRYRRTWPTLDEAKYWVDATQGRLASNIRPLLAPERMDAVEALRVLRGRASLTQAARYFVEMTCGNEDISYAEAVAKYLDEKQAAGLRPRSLKSSRLILERYGQMLLLSSIQAQTVVHWLDEAGLTGTTRDNHRRALSAFFGWCQRAGWIPRNPVDGVTRPRVDHGRPGILTVDQMRCLLEAARAEGVLAFVALGGFAGLRNSEATQLSWDAVTDEYILVDSEIAKTAQRRYVHIEPNLQAILVSCKAILNNCPIWPANGRRALERARRAAGIEDWPQNALRHSYASYHLAKWQDAARTAHEMGHTRTDVLFRHYRNLVTRTEAEAWWQIGLE